MGDLTIKELGALISKATENFKAQEKDNAALVLTFKKQASQYEELKKDFETAREEGKAVDTKKLSDSLDELQEDMSDMRSKYKHPAAAISEEDQKKAVRQIVMKAVGSIVKQNKKNQGDVFDEIKKEIDLQVKTLNITTPAEGGLAVAEVLAMEVMDYAREFSPVAQLIMMKSGITRDYRQMIKVTYPGVSEGIENVPGTVPAQTSTQKYVEVRSKEFKLYASPRITNEALLGTDINVYADLLVCLGEEIGIYLASQLLFGDGLTKNCRGILSSNRIDLTDATGESFLPTLTPDGTGSRDSDYFPAIPTGVSGAIGADDLAIANFVIDVTNALPSRYLAKAKWIMNRKSKGKFEKVRDAQERPIFVHDYIPGLPGKQLILNGHQVIIDDTMPDIAADSTFAIFGDLEKAFAMNKGDIDQMLLDPYTIKGSLLVYTEKEYFEMIQRSDAILVCAATTNGPA